VLDSEQNHQGDLNDSRAVILMLFQNKRMKIIIQNPAAKE